jgi:hypothetical protein
MYIGGGIVPRLGKLFTGSRFRERFEGKGRLSSYLARIPTWLIVEEYPALRGVAAMLDEAATITITTPRRHHGTNRTQSGHRAHGARTAAKQHRPAGDRHHPVLHVGPAHLAERRPDPAPEGHLHAQLRAGDAGAVLLLRRLLHRLGAGRRADPQGRLPEGRRHRPADRGGRLRAVLPGLEERLRPVPVRLLRAGERHHHPAGGGQSLRDRARPGAARRPAASR